MKPANNNVAFYMRLSKEDTRAGESSSIENQRKILINYIAGQDMIFYSEYIDDGISGIEMNRPGLNAMINDIRAGIIGIVITKDFSRLGRNSARTQLMLDEFFPKYRIRYIAVTDGIDTMPPCSGRIRSSSSNILAPLLSFTNELYAADISKKIRASFTAKMENGEYIGSAAPYGYIKDPINRNHLIPDPETAPVVQYIFRLASDGMTPRQIATALDSERISVPSVRNGRKPSPGSWSYSTVYKILSNEVYIGNTLQGKTFRPSFKSKNAISLPEEEWIRKNNTHEALITEKCFFKTSDIISARRRFRSGGKSNIFSGIAICKDCGRNMSSCISKKSRSVDSLICGGYKQKGKNFCTSHKISYNLLCSAVFDELKKDVCLSCFSNDDFISEYGREILLHFISEIYIHERGKFNGDDIITIEIHTKYKCNDRTFFYGDNIPDVTTQYK